MRNMNLVVFYSVVIKPFFTFISILLFCIWLTSSGYFLVTTLQDSFNAGQIVLTSGIDSSQFAKSIEESFLWISAFFWIFSSIAAIIFRKDIYAKALAD